MKKGTYTGRIVKSSIGSVMIGKISGYRGTGEPVYDVHKIGERVEMLEKVGELSNFKIKELLQNEKVFKGRSFRKIRSFDFKESGKSYAQTVPHEFYRVIPEYDWIKRKTVYTL